MWLNNTIHTIFLNYINNFSGFQKNFKIYEMKLIPSINAVNRLTSSAAAILSSLASAVSNFRVACSNSLFANYVNNQHLIRPIFSIVSG